MGTVPWSTLLTFALGQLLEVAICPPVLLEASGIRSFLDILWHGVRGWRPDNLAAKGRSSCRISCRLDSAKSLSPFKPKLPTRLVPFTPKYQLSIQSLNEGWVNLNSTSARNSALWLCFLCLRGQEWTARFLRIVAAPRQQGVKGIRSRVSRLL